MNKYQNKNDGRKLSIEDTISELVVIIIISGICRVGTRSPGLEAVVLVAIISAAVSLIGVFVNSVLSKILNQIIKDVNI